ncbi:MAG: putative bifunctional diguanylate cyclase/phosphodiesterase [Aquabacterium sp.]
MLLRLGGGTWPWLGIGCALGWWWGGQPVHVALPLAAGQVATAWVAARGLQRHAFDVRMEQRRDLVLLLTTLLLGMPLLAAANSAGWMTLAGQVDATELLPTLAALATAEALGGLLVAIPPLAAGWGVHRPMGGTSLGAWRSGLAVAAAAAGGISILGLPPSALPLAAAGLLAAPLALTMLTLGLGLLCSSLCGVTWAAAALALHLSGAGPFDLILPGGGDGLLQAWLAIGALAALLPHAARARGQRESDRWRRGTALAGVGLADWHLPSGTGFTSARWQDLLEPMQRDAVVGLERWLRRVHPEDRPGLSDALSGTDTDAPQQTTQRRLRIFAREQWRWYDLKLDVAERAADGQPVRVVATVGDADMAQRMDDRERLSASLFQHLHEGMLIADAEMRVLDANPAYCRIVGLGRDAVVGQVPVFLRTASPDPQTRALQSALWAALRSRGTWVGDLADRRADGSACLLHTTISSVSDPDGALRYHVLVVTDITEQREQRIRLERQALFDELTRLPNRAQLSQQLAQAMSAADRDGHLLAVCCVDLDHFKAVNESLGHATGDRLLQEVARRLQSGLRTRGGIQDVAARLGGDEFVLLLRAATIDEARAAAERVLRILSLPFDMAASSGLKVSASMGATLYPLDSSDADTLLRHADHALFGAKQAGRNGVLFFDPEHVRRSEERVMAVGRVQEALDRGQLVPYYQPKVDMRRGTVVGVEALLRWIHPEDGVVLPSHFLPAVENTGLSVRIGDHMLARALDQLDQWQAQGLDLSVSVNVSARHLQEPDFAQRLGELLARHTRPLGHRLELEILETAALADIEHTASVLARCARLGVRCALDDFGTGYSTLTYLKRLPIQVLKIDRSFVLGMLDDPQDLAIVEGVVSLARTFDCVAVAEGVETPAQARSLLDMGCLLGQGNGIAVPMPAEALPDWMAGWRGLFALTAAPAAPLPPRLASGDPRVS